MQPRQSALSQQAPAPQEWAVVLLLTGLALLLPTRNSTPDAWYYAACVRHGHELLLPHHLLYNVVGWLWAQLLPATFDTLAALKVLNALAFGGSLLVLRSLLRSLLRRVGGAGAPVAGWLLLAGSSFGMLRFATENETYVLPLLLSLLASRSWWRAAAGETGRRGWLSAGAWAAGAALLHQIHAFWWLGLLVGLLWARPAGRWVAAVWYGLPALLVPVAYAAALPSWQLPFTLQAFWEFVFYELYHGHAGAAPSGRTLLLMGVSVVRTFGQLHGSTLALLQRWPLLAGVALLCVGLMLMAGWRIWRSYRTRLAARRLQYAVAEHELAAPVGTDAVLPELFRTFHRTHLLILLLHLACALWAAGNAEFLVMLPALLALLLVRQPWPGQALVLAGVALLLWNLTFGLLPAFLLRFTNTTPLLTRIEQEPTAFWLLSDPNLLLNQLHYRTGRPVGPPTILSAPALLVQRPGQSAAGLRAWLRRCQAAGQPVYTDALYGPRLLDRARLTQGDDATQRQLLRGFRLVRVDSMVTAFGWVYLTRVQ
ncbi:hypothetical protein [Hymenobacter canadensis]|uniref:Glycosyltransferase RgtA/B/C/D-like domain-containing protein n=1 Tax=Hymenobacter canadensis TaxID=2999067 RepID=A0ABY7LPB0_9BACT|nr:hypothetical protein [Hymenobacter canadensis]WBA41684.1 hypothetical protein O3303_17965 [Hymenobacter canadensis]